MENIPQAKYQKEWLTPRDLFEEYEFSESTQSKMRMRKDIPFSKVGGYVRYNRSTINQWLEDHHIETSSNSSISPIS